MANNLWLKSTDPEGRLRVVVIQLESQIQEMAQLHSLGQSHGAIAIGEACLAALLLASYCKQGEGVHLLLKSSGPVQRAFVDAHWDGRIRGYLTPAELVSERPAATTGPWGEGTLSVMRMKPGQPFTGVVPLITGHLAKDLTYYWAQSEQVPSAVGIQVADVPGQGLRGAAFLIQTLPGTSADEIKEIESALGSVPALLRAVASGDASPELLMASLYPEGQFQILEKQPIERFCLCSLEKVVGAMGLLSEAELRDILLKERKAEVECDFCRTKYTLGEGQILKIISDLKP